MDSLPTPNLEAKKKGQEDLEKVRAIRPIFEIDKTSVTKDTIRFYMTALSEFTAEEIRDAVSNFVHGRVPGWNGDFRPNGPQLAMECRRITRGDKAWDRIWNKEARKAGGVVHKDGKLIPATNPKLLGEAKKRDAQGNVILPDAFQEYKKNLGEMETEKWKVWAEREEARMQEVNAHWSPPYGQLAIEALKKKDEEV